MKGYLIHYHEIALKKGNRAFFVNKLVENILSSVKDLGSFRVEKTPGRIFLDCEKDFSSKEEVEERLMRIPGIANFLFVSKVGLDLEEIKKELDKTLELNDNLSFRIDTKRGDKSYPMTSEEVNRELGSFVQEKTKARVDLGNPDVTVCVEVVSDGIFFGFEKMNGIGGLPVGSSGKVVSLLSSGIDSPVSSYMMMKRGCKVIFAHFHSFPYLDTSTQDKADELAKVLNQCQTRSKIYYLSFGDAQNKVVQNAPESYRVIIYRRLMLRVADQIAKKENAGALVTGDSLGQVASQTMENISAIGNAVSIPVFRPLIGMNKDEIIELAKKIDTYDISIRPDQDCCQLFMPKHPETRGKIERVEKIEKEFDIEKIVFDIVESAKLKEI